MPTPSADDTGGSAPFDDAPFDDAPGEGAPATNLAIYALLDRFRGLGYVGKILLVTFLGIHVPLIVLVAWLALVASAEPQENSRVLVIALAATLAGTAITLWVLQHLLRPISMTSAALRRYASDGVLPQLPTGHHDAAGTLMSDTGHALRRLDATIGRLGTTDEITGLANRVQFLRALAARIQGRGEREDARPGGARAFAVCTLRLERLGALVSALGQSAADRVLREGVRRAESALRYRGHLARIDTQTFALLLDDPGAPGELADLAAELVRLLGGAGGEDGMDLHCRAGLSIYPHDGDDAERLLDNCVNVLGSDARRHETVVFYSGAHRRELLERLQLERELGLAIAREELVLHYQPVVDAGSLAITGVEALIRWQHPSRGLLMPSEFIMLAEQSELIERIGRWTLGTACAQLRAWQDRGATGLKVAVNLSARQFHDPSLPDHVREVLERSGIAPASLEIELTETSAMIDATRTAVIMKRLVRLGVGIAIDDFGTGYSSLSYLSTMPFDKLKIDRAFVRDVASNRDHLAICRALIALAHELGLAVLAEGTESASEVAALRAEGCDVFQGYYFHRPMSAAKVGTLLEPA